MDFEGKTPSNFQILGFYPHLKTPKMHFDAEQCQKYHFFREIFGCFLSFRARVAKPSYKIFGHFQGWALSNSSVAYKKCVGMK